MDLDNTTAKCDGTSGEICTKAYSTCKGGSALKSCENGEGLDAGCRATSGCGGDYKHALTNASGC